MPAIRAAAPVHRAGERRDPDASVVRGEHRAGTSGQWRAGDGFDAAVRQLKCVAFGRDPQRTVARGGECERGLADFGVTFPRARTAQRPERAFDVGHPERAVGGFSECRGCLARRDEPPRCAIEKMHAGRRRDRNAAVFSRDDRGDQTAQRRAGDSGNGRDVAAVERCGAIERADPEHAVSVLRERHHRRLRETAPRRFTEDSEGARRAPFVGAEKRQRQREQHAEKESAGSSPGH